MACGHGGPGRGGAIIHFSCLFMNYRGENYDLLPLGHGKGGREKTRKAGWRRQEGRDIQKVDIPSLAQHHNKGQVSCVELRGGKEEEEEAASWGREEGVGTERRGLAGTFAEWQGKTWW